MVALTLQRSLHSAYSDPDAIVPLLTTLTSFLTSEEDLVHLTQLNRKDSVGLMKQLHPPNLTSGHGAGDGSNGGKDAMVEEFKRVTFPELLSWVAQNKSTNSNSNSTNSSDGRASEVAVAVSRVLGRISLVDHKTHRTVGNLLSEDMLALLCANYTSSHPLVSSVSALALWHVVHHSEKGKHIVRELINRYPQQTSPSPTGVSGSGKENVQYERNYDTTVGNEMGEEEEVERDWELEGAQKARFVIDALRAVS